MRALAYRVRPMRKEDVPQVNEIDREAFPEQWPPANYRHELDNILAHYIVAYDEDRSIEVAEQRSSIDLFGLSSRIRRMFGWSPDGHEPVTVERQHYIVGFAGIWMMADEAHITNIAVRQEYRRQGIGEQLLMVIFDLARELKARLLTLEVRVSNTVAQNLYEKFGFARVGLRKGYYTDRFGREDAVLMSTGDINTPGFQERLEGLKRTLARR
ncbi:MAG: ribosomal protein S18-alanine N-acetyltransferase [Chloroflexi bacterium]|nr:ribosomal protein S18-alanine N-acetyltransferase [Chloroflexota bacterium]